MKKLLFIAVMSAVMLSGGAFKASADTVFVHDDHGYWDRDHHHHNYEYNGHHRGYWDQRNGTRVFISL